VTTLQIVVLAIVQGLTEFLPISSSGHLVIVPYLVDWTDQGLAFDVAVHFGSLLAVCAFFRDDIMGLLRGGVRILGGDFKSPQAYMALAIGLGTIPAAAAGLMFAGWIELNLRDPAVMVILLDVVLGYGAYQDPAGALLETIATVPAESRPLIVASVCGTDADPQNRSAQVSSLAQQGVVVANSNAEAARWALRIASDD